jgi:hypothetical protein
VAVKAMGVKRLGHDGVTIAYSQHRLMASNGVVESGWGELVGFHEKYVPSKLRMSQSCGIHCLFKSKPRQTFPISI